MEEENVFKKRKPKIFVIMDEKWKKELEERLGGEIPFYLICYMASMIEELGYAPYGVFIERLGDLIVLIEAPEMYIPYSKQGYMEDFMKLYYEAKETGKEEDIKKLFEKYPPDYTFFPRNEKEKTIIVATLKAYKKFYEKHMEMIEKIKKAIGVH